MSKLRTKIVIVFATAGMLMLLRNSIDAHDLVGDQHYQWDHGRLTYMPIDRSRQTTPASSGVPAHLFYVIVLPNKWANLQQIHVCFKGGSDQLRSKILDTAQLWFDHTNLTLMRSAPANMTCKDQDKSEVRIGFSEPGYWSYIGNDSLNSTLISQNLSSMNFQGFDTNPPAEPQFTGAILHEWGHALGLHHEHQSPAGGCDAHYDWPKLYAYYQSSYGWNQSMVDQNLRQLDNNSSAYDWSQLDPQSIMIYASDPQFLKDGTNDTCFFHENYQLSQTDIVGIETVAYPKAAAALTLQIQKQNLQLLLKNYPNLKGELKSALSTQLRLSTTQINTNKNQSQ